MKNKVMKVAIIGSRQYSDKRKIKNFIFKLKEKYGDDVEIVSGEQKYGADGIAKKVALEFDMKYVSFPPAHYSYNCFCINPPENYGKPYKVTNYFERNKQIAEYSDCCVCFIPDGHKSKGTNNTIKHCLELGKKVVVIN